MREETLRRLRATDWGDRPVHVQLDGAAFDKPEERQTHTASLALRAFLGGGAEYLLFLEDDLAFNRHLRHNLLSWTPLVERQVTLASLYNPFLGELAVDIRNRAVVIDARTVFGSQAFLLSRQTAAYVAAHWKQVEGMQDLRMARLAGRLGRPILYHAPSLVQHLGKRSLWGGSFHYSADFDGRWRA